MAKMKLSKLLKIQNTVVVYTLESGKVALALNLEIDECSVRYRMNITD